MPYAIELNLSPNLDSRVRNTWDALDRYGLAAHLPGGRPHISIAVAESVNETDIAPRLREFAFDYSPLKLTLNAIDTFQTGVVFVAPEMSEDLRAIHAAFHERFDLAPAAISHYYMPGQWTPHCTLAQNVSSEQMSEVLQICSFFTKLPQRGTLNSLSLVRWPGAEERQHHPLGR